MAIELSTSTMNSTGCLPSSSDRPLVPQSESSNAIFRIDLPTAHGASAISMDGAQLLSDPADDRSTSDSQNPGEEIPLFESLLWPGCMLPLWNERSPADPEPPSDENPMPLNSGLQDPQARKNSIAWAIITPDQSAPAITNLAELNTAGPPIMNEMATVTPTDQSMDNRVAHQFEAMNIDSSDLLIESSSQSNKHRDITAADQGEVSSPHPATDGDRYLRDLSSPDTVVSAAHDRPANIVSMSNNLEHSHSSTTLTKASHRTTSQHVELRTELSEIVRHVRTIVTQGETRSTIQLEPSDLGRLTLEIVDAPLGMRASISAEDPSVQRYLERNIQLLEAEARLQGLSSMSFTVDTGSSNGFERNAQQQDEPESHATLNKVWPVPQSSIPRSRRELDTSA